MVSYVCRCPHENCGERFHHHGDLNETTACPHCGRQQKPHLERLEDLTEPELQALTTEILHAVKARLPAETGFAVLFFPMGQPGVAQYGSNCRREDMVKTLREAADRLAKREDIPR